MKHVIVRTARAGVFAGYLESQKKQTATLRHARRLWYWEGAASLSQLAIDGVKFPLKCKFPNAVESIEVFEVIEIIPTTDKARESIACVPEWKA